MIEQKDILQLQEQIKTANKIVILPHRDPDGDAISSSLGLKLLLEAQGKEVSLVSYNLFPSFLMFLKDAEQFIYYEKTPEKATEAIQHADMLFMVDFNTLSRIETLADIIRQTSIFSVMIDHHPEPTEKVDLMFSDPQSSSTSQLLFDIAQALSWEVSKEAATCLLTGLITDTGYFNHNTNGHRAFKITSQLMELGANLDLIRKKIFHSNTQNRYQLVHYLLHQKCNFLPQYNMAYITLTKEEKNKYYYQIGDTEGVVNVPLNIKKVKISILLTETEEDFVKISFRSKETIAINEFAAKYFKGGGHKYAAGGRFNGTLKEAVDALKKAMEEWHLAS